MLDIVIAVHRDPRYFFNRGTRYIRVPDPDFAAFCAAIDTGPALYTVTATLAGEEVGFFRVSRGLAGDMALGTFVRRDCRRQGIATALWRHARAELGLGRVHAVAITDDGRGFLAAISRDADLQELFLDSEASDC